MVVAPRRGDGDETPAPPAHATALAILVIGALAVGVPTSFLAIGVLVLACPLMMLRRPSQLAQHTYEEE